MSNFDSDVFSLPTEADTHNHDYHQLVVVLDGNTDFDIKGNSRQLHFGEGCIVPSAEGHAFAGLGKNRIMVVNLPVPPQKAITDEEYEIVSRLFDQAAYFELNPRLQILASALSGELEQYPEDSILARACGNTLLSAIRHQINNKDSRIRGNNLDIDKLDQFIELNLSKKVHISQLANFCFLSVSQFHERFKDHTGMTPHQYLVRKRLDRAQSLLKKGYPPIQVAEMCGFSSQSAMTNVFSQTLGITPLKYQKKYRGH
ncbi:helix-turn-helix domain-containing protein [Marinomonas mediterranea]|uniref:Transcriptional regulator with cupin sensor, AraC family n=1 Tax=Marinomonas mediterranea (strain ATCC 700492 / JCM 21426 / NBRC 103028 / MMB-1) TaxID=717774 RepID=F2K117_MARM1|nr:AraC family transcriptional regulator [Marinomonas mediterranea]ADZ93366.1 transcriptional regulator with cupin sensor, AraC family [Marinomonas mediterranea MMB-1]WCN11254.1 helix-turn-helix domain-containing protein [Marinomonas mediterranea]WCN15318.1 helix-turn-helix domain-containing protein [Marinomonas mediterranea]WCN19362.1 helix-turn-helix domain-containing protein [Marinomonas mediterranea MMB-1]